MGPSPYMFRSGLAPNGMGTTCTLPGFGVAWASAVSRLEKSVEAVCGAQRRLARFPGIAAYLPWPPEPLTEQAGGQCNGDPRP
jgi:hypothetical protein